MKKVFKIRIVLLVLVVKMPILGRSNADTLNRLSTPRKYPLVVKMPIVQCRRADLQDYFFVTAFRLHFSQASIRSSIFPS